MKSTFVLGLILVSSNVFSQTSTTKAHAAVQPKSVQAQDTVKVDKKAEAPCADKKEDVLKKIEEKKKAQAAASKGFSLQGNTDTGCSIK